MNSSSVLSDFKGIFKIFMIRGWVRIRGIGHLGFS